MRRIFWLTLGVGVGAVGAVILVRRVEATVRRYTPEGVAEQVGDASRAARSSLGHAAATFRAARAEREEELITSLLVEPEEGDPRAVFGGRRDASPWEDPWDRDVAADPRSARAAAPRPARGSARPPGRVDATEPLADF